MVNIDKNFIEEEDGFNGNYEGYVIDTNKENLQNWLVNEISDTGDIYNAVSKYSNKIFILKNINIEEGFRGQGYGTDILEDALSEALNLVQADSVILLSDSSETQDEGFVLEKFYESQGFKEISNHEGYPLMVYPEDIANKIKEKLKSLKQNKIQKLKL